jgi:hypothetical protein
MGESFSELSSQNEYENKIFKSYLPSLLPDHVGKWALVFDENVKVFPDAETADGFARTASIPHYLIKKIEPPAPRQRKHN